jgi:hypothetical protein
MLLVPKNERRVRRAAIEVECQIVREADYKVVARRSFDLSTEGALVPSESDVAIGEPLLVSFRATGFGILFATTGHVARVVAGRRNGDRARCLGVSFRLDPLARHLLRGGLRRVPPPLPKRDRRIDYAATVEAIATTELDLFYFD